MTPTTTQITHQGVVKSVNERVVEFPHKSRVRGRVRITGTDHRTIRDGYQAVCRSCDWSGDLTQYLSIATAQASGHTP